MRTGYKLEEFGRSQPVKSILYQDEELSFMTKHGRVITRRMAR